DRAHPGRGHARRRGRGPHLGARPPLIRSRVEHSMRDMSLERTSALAIAVFAACGSKAPGAPDAAMAPDASVDASAAPAVALRDAPGASGTGFGDPHNAVDGVRGGGASSGSTDVYSLGYSGNDSITLAWSAGRLHNGAGADLAVFENPFDESGGGVFMDQIVVE